MDVLTYLNGRGVFKGLGQKNFDQGAKFNYYDKYLAAALVFFRGFSLKIL
jgi:hypothetical protein